MQNQETNSVEVETRLHRNPGYNNVASVCTVERASKYSRAVSRYLLREQSQICNEQTTTGNAATTYLVSKKWKIRMEAQMYAVWSRRLVPPSIQFLRYTYIHKYVLFLFRDNVDNVRDTIFAYRNSDRPTLPLPSSIDRQNVLQSFLRAWQRVSSLWDSFNRDFERKAAMSRNAVENRR